MSGRTSSIDFPRRSGGSEGTPADPSERGRAREAERIGILILSQKAGGAWLNNLNRGSGGRISIFGLQATNRSLPCCMTRTSDLHVAPTKLAMSGSGCRRGRSCFARRHTSRLDISRLPGGALARSAPAIDVLIHPRVPSSIEHAPPPLPRVGAACPLSRSSDAKRRTASPSGSLERGVGGGSRHTSSIYMCEPCCRAPSEKGALTIHIDNVLHEPSPL